MKVNKVDELTEKAGHAIRENIAHIIFGAVILFMVFLSFVNMGRDKKAFDWFNFFVNFLMQMSLFVPYRWRQKRLSGAAEPYKTNKKLYGERVQNMRANNELNKFSEFCEVKTEELKRCKQLEIVHAAGIDTNTYDAGDYSKLGDMQRKAIERAKRVQVKPVNPLCITSNSSRIKGYGVDFDDDAEDYKSIINKVTTFILWAIILTYIAVDGIKYGGIAAVVLIIFRIVMCLMAMFSGVMSGDGFVVKKDKVILRRIDFIDLFHEWQSAQAESSAQKTE